MREYCGRHANNTHSELLVLVAGPYRRAPVTSRDGSPPTSGDERSRARGLPRGPPARDRRGARAAARRGRGQRWVGDPVFDQIFHPIARRLLGRCDAVLRIGGASAGADEMVEIARARGELVVETAGISRRLILKQERQGRILEILGAEGRVVAAELPGGASACRATPSGATSMSSPRRAACSASTAARWRDRRSRRPTRAAGAGGRGKIATARAAASLLEPGRSVVLDGGSTALHLVDAMPEDQPAPFVTHSPPVARALPGARRGDRHRRRDAGSPGDGRRGRHGRRGLPPRVTADLCFLGVWALHPVAGSAPGTTRRRSSAACWSARRPRRRAGLAREARHRRRVRDRAAGALTHLATEPDVPEAVLAPFGSSACKSYSLRAPIMPTAAHLASSASSTCTLRPACYAPSSSAATGSLFPPPAAHRPLREGPGPAPGRGLRGAVRQWRRSARPARASTGRARGPTPVRRLGRRRARLTIDFVVHGDDGVAGPWAAAAQPGDELLLHGPGGAYAPDPDADWHLMVGDAASSRRSPRRCAGPAGRPVHVVLEVDGRRRSSRCPRPATCSDLAARAATTRSPTRSRRSTSRPAASTRSCTARRAPCARSAATCWSTRPAARGALDLRLLEAHAHRGGLARGQAGVEPPRRGGPHRHALGVRRRGRASGSARSAPPRGLALLARGRRALLGLRFGFLRAARGLVRRLALALGDRGLLLGLLRLGVGRLQPAFALGGARLRLDPAVLRALRGLAPPPPATPRAGAGRRAR